MLDSFLFIWYTNLEFHFPYYYVLLFSITLKYYPFLISAMINRIMGPFVHCLFSALENALHVLSIFQGTMRLIRGGNAVTHTASQ